MPSMTVNEGHAFAGRSPTKSRRLGVASEPAHASITREANRRLTQTGCKRERHDQTNLRWSRHLSCPKDPHHAARPVAMALIPDLGAVNLSDNLLRSPIWQVADGNKSYARLVIVHKRNWTGQDGAVKCLQRFDPWHLLITIKMKRSISL